MFHLTPYQKQNEVSYYDPFRMMEEMERRFWGDNGMTSFKTDIRDEGNAFVLEAELPPERGHRHSAQRQQPDHYGETSDGVGGEGQGGQLYPPGAQLGQLQPELRCFGH